MLRNSAINLCLKLGLALPLLYATLAAFVVPDHVLSLWPTFISTKFNESILVFISGLATFALVVWLFSRKWKFQCAISITILIALVGLLNITNIPFVMTLAPLFFIAAGLTLRYYPRIRIMTQTRVTPLAHITPLDDLDDEDDEGEVVESDIHAEHDQHIFVPKQ